MRITADLLLVAHLAFVLFVLLGGLAVLWRRWVVVFHVPAAAWGVFVEFSGRICPLTPLENALRLQSGQSGYEGDFVGHYLLRVLYPDELTRGVQFTLGGIALVVNMLIYGMILLRSRRPPRQRDF